MTDTEAAEFAEYLRDERERRRARDTRTGSGGMYRRAMMRAYAESIGVDHERALAEFDTGGAAPATPAGEARDAAPPTTRVEPAASAVARRSGATPRPRRTLRRPAATPTRVPAGAAALALLVVAGGMIWSVSGGDSQPAVRIAHAGAGTAQTPTGTPPTVGERLQPPARTTPSTVHSPQSAARVQAAEGRMRPASRAPQAAHRAAARPAASRPAAIDGTLSVTSHPSGARVTVNGIGWGETPVTIRHLDFGQKRIRVTMQGYVSQERLTHLSASEPTSSARFVLRRRTVPPVAAASR